MVSTTGASSASKAVRLWIVRCLWLGALAAGLAAIAGQHDSELIGIGRTCVVRFIVPTDGEPIARYFDQIRGAYNAVHKHTSSHEIEALFGPAEQLASTFDSDDEHLALLVGPDTSRDARNVYIDPKTQKPRAIRVPVLLTSVTGSKLRELLASYRNPEHPRARYWFAAPDNVVIATEIADTARRLTSPDCSGSSIDYDTMDPDYAQELADQLRRQGVGEAKADSDKPLCSWILVGNEGWYDLAPPTPKKALHLILADGLVEKNVIEDLKERYRKASFSMPQLLVARPRSPKSNDSSGMTWTRLAEVSINGALDKILREDPDGTGSLVDADLTIAVGECKNCVE